MKDYKQIALDGSICEHWEHGSCPHCRYEELMEAHRAGRAEGLKSAKTIAYKSCEDYAWRLKDRNEQALYEQSELVCVSIACKIQGELNSLGAIANSKPTESK